jgi:short-subunit dehydrogenase
MATQAHPLARSSTRPLAIVTGASSGIGRELAIIAAQEGFDLILAADESLVEVCVDCQAQGARVPWDVARLGFRAAMNGEADIVTGLKNRLQVAAAHITPSQTLARQHRKLAEPGSAAS